jgi:hypothetical protein
MRTLTLASILCLTLLGLCQSDSSKLVTTYAVQEVAQFPGGNDSFNIYLTNNLIYPEEAMEKEIHGKVIIQFDVDKDGNVTDVKVLTTNLYQNVEEPTGKRRKTKTVKKKLEGDYDYCLGTCASNLVSNSPKWKPATQRGRPVKMRFRIPIRYEIY